MNTQQQARALMMRHHQVVRNRQQTMLSRSASEIGLEEVGEHWTGAQGKLSNAALGYDRSPATMS